MRKIDFEPETPFERRRLRRNEGLLFSPVRDEMYGLTIIRKRWVMNEPVEISTFSVFYGHQQIFQGDARRLEFEAHFHAGDVIYDHQNVEVPPGYTSLGALVEATLTDEAFPRIMSGIGHGSFGEEVRPMLPTLRGIVFSTCGILPRTVTTMLPPENVETARNANGSALTVDTEFVYFESRNPTADAEPFRVAVGPGGDVLQVLSTIGGAERAGNELLRR